jgi:hypothetical protein
LTITNDENQLGMLADLTDIITQHGWDLTGYFQQRESHGGGRAIQLDIRPASGATSEEELMAALKDYRRERHGRPPVEDGQWLSVRLELRNVPGAIREVAKTFAGLKTSIESGTEASMSSDGASGTFNFVVYAPRSLQVREIGNRFRKQTSSIINIDVTRTDVGEETAGELSRILKEHRRETERGRVAKVTHPRPKDPHVNWNYVKLFEAAIDLMYRYHGYPDNHIPLDGRTAAWQNRKSNPALSYAAHPLEVCQIYLDEFHGRDETFLLVSLLHDVLEDAPKYVLEYYEAMLNMTNWDQTVMALQRRFPTDDYPDLAAALNSTQRLEDLRASIMQAAIQEISRDIEETFGPRLLEVLRLYDHSHSSFKESIEGLSGKDIADFLAVKAADQVSNLATAAQAGNLEKTLSKLVRHLLPAMALDPSRRTTVYSRSRVGLLKAITQAAADSKEDWPLFKNVNWEKRFVEMMRDAQWDTIKSGSQVLVMMRNHPEFLGESKPEDIARFEALIRRHVKTQVAKLVKFPEPPRPSTPEPVAALTGRERRQARWLSWVGAFSGGWIGLWFALSQGWISAPSFTPAFILTVLAHAGLWALLAHAVLRLAEWMQEWRGHIDEMRSQGFTELKVLPQLDGGLRAEGQAPIGLIDWPRIGRAGPLQNARLLAAAITGFLGLFKLPSLVPIGHPTTQAVALIVTIGLSGLTAFLGSQILSNLRLIFSDQHILWRTCGKGLNRIVREQQFAA